MPLVASNGVEMSLSEWPNIGSNNGLSLGGRVCLVLECLKTVIIFDILFVTASGT